MSWVNSSLTSAWNVYINLVDMLKCLYKGVNGTDPMTRTILNWCVCVFPNPSASSVFLVMCSAQPSGMLCIPASQQHWEALPHALHWDSVCPYHGGTRGQPVRQRGPAGDGQRHVSDSVIVCCLFTHTDNTLQTLIPITYCLEIQLWPVQLVNWELYHNWYLP